MWSPNGPSSGQVALLHVALEHDLRVGRDLDADRLPGDELDRLALEEAREHELVDVLRQRRRGRVRGHRVEPQRDGDLEPAVRGQVVHAPVLVELPVHRGRARVELLHPVHADVPRPGLRVVRDHGRQRDERRGVARPAVLDREQVEVDVVAGEHDVVMGCGAHRLRARVRDRLQLLEAAHLVDETLGRLHLEHGAELRGCVVKAVDSEREAHAALGAELVDEERVRRASSASRTGAPARLRARCGRRSRSPRGTDRPRPTRERARPRARGARSRSEGRPAAPSRSV